MENATFFISLLLLFASLYYFFCKIILSPNPKKVTGYQLPPGSTGWPFIGETLEYLRTIRDGVPEKFIADRRKKYSDISSLSSSAATGGSCKVFKTSLLGESMAMLCTAAGNKFLFSNEDKLVRSWYPTSFKKLFSGSKKRDFFQERILNRKLLSPFLKPDCIRKHVGVMDQVTKHHFDTHWSPVLDQNQVIKFHSLMKKYNLTLSCRLFLNNEDPEVIAKLVNSIQHISAGLVSLPIDLPGTNFNRTIKTSIQMRKEVQSMVAQRKIEIMNMNSFEREQLENAPQDLMSSLLMGTYNDEEDMSEDIAKRLCSVLLGSYDNIINTLCSTVMFLSKLPPVYESVLKEQMEIAESKEEGELLNWDDIQKMKYTWNVVCEVLRLQPSFSGTYREAISDFVYDGFLIPKGMKLHWNVHATYKNPEYFPDPHKFDPSRFEGNGPPPYSYIPFGGGPRMCPGKELARVQLLVFIHNMITKFEWEMVFPDEKMVSDPLPFPSQGLPLHVNPHK